MQWLGPIEDTPPPTGLSLADSLRAGGFIFLLGALSLGLGTLWWHSASGDHGLERTWYGDSELDRRIDRDIGGVIHHRWLSSPHPGVPEDRFSISWRGCIDVPEPGLRIVGRSDGGLTVEVAGKTYLDRWKRTTRHFARSRDTLPVGIHPIAVDARHRNGQSDMYLGWAYQNHAHAPVPLHRLLPPDHPDCK